MSFHPAWINSQGKLSNALVTLWMRYVGGLSADGSQLHEQAKAGGVGESLEPGGAVAIGPFMSEVAPCDGSAPGSMKRRANLTHGAVRATLAQNLTKKHSQGLSEAFIGDGRLARKNGATKGTK